MAQILLNLLRASDLFVGLLVGSISSALGAHGVLIGCLFTTIIPTFQLLFPKARGSEFYSATGLLSSLDFVVLPPTAGASLDATGHVYRDTFLTGALLGLLGFVGMLVVHQRFMALGGPTGDVAPE